MSAGQLDVANAWLFQMSGDVVEPLSLWPVKVGLLSWR